MWMWSGTQYLNLFQSKITSKVHVKYFKSVTFSVSSLKCYHSLELNKVKNDANHYDTLFLPFQKDIHHILITMYARKV